MADHIHDALKQVRAIRREILESRRFSGYSGRARIYVAMGSLAGATVLSRPFYPRSNEAYLVGWVVIAAAGLLVNYGALIRWFLCERSVKRDIGELMPTIDALPPLFIGGVLTAALVSHGQYDLLFGVWMCLFGLANLASRRALPASMYSIGLYYILFGTVCLLNDNISFFNPWPMGIVFFAGEMAGGLVFHQQNRRKVNERYRVSIEDVGS